MSETFKLLIDGVDYALFVKGTGEAQESIDGSSAKCSGKNCPLNYTVDISRCGCTDTCQYFTPAFDVNGMNKIVDMAMQRFNIDDKDRKDFAEFFAAYAGEALRQIGRI